MKTRTENKKDITGGSVNPPGIMPVGWICPKCGRGNAPTTSTCPCQPVNYTPAEQTRRLKESFKFFIKRGREGLKVLQEQCPHENTYLGDYSWRIGVIEKRTICKDCGKVFE